MQAPTAPIGHAAVDGLECRSLPRKPSCNSFSGRGLLTRSFIAALIPMMAFSPPASSQAPPCNAAEGRPTGGAYRTTHGTVMSVLPVGAQGRWRITHFDSGSSHQLYSEGASKFKSASDLDSQDPVAFRYEFRSGATGVAESLVIESKSEPPVIARRVALVERLAAFKSGDVDLSGRLTLPRSGGGPFKAVIFVHGSDPVPSAGLEWLPHLLASNGIATLVFDKRGTGCSKGQYVQHFDVLANDVVAAARWLQAQPEIVPGQIGLAGFSQGGWVAPLAALKDSSIKFVAVGYGLAMSMADEDRLEAPLKLKEQGVDEASIGEFRALNAALHKLARENFQDWGSFEQHVERVKDQPWFAVAARQQSWLGITMQMGLAKAKAVAPPMFTNFFQPFYDPVPTLESLDIPMLWLMAGRDIEAPPEPTLEVLARLRRLGKPVSVVVFPNADHGMQDFEVHAGKRVRTKYADQYFSTLLKWLQNPK